MSSFIASIITYISGEKICTFCDKKKEKESEFFCTKHCHLGIHFHCKFIGCDKKKEDDANEDCSSHCKISGHGHCTSFECSESSHDGGNDKCILHCKVPHHGHCIGDGCGKKTHKDEQFCRAVYKNNHGIYHLNLDGLTPEYI